MRCQHISLLLSVLALFSILCFATSLPQTTDGRQKIKSQVHHVKKRQLSYVDPSIVQHQEGPDPEDDQPTDPDDGDARFPYPSVMADDTQPRKTDGQALDWKILTNFSPNQMQQVMYKRRKRAVDNMWKTVGFSGARRVSPITNSKRAKRQSTLTGQQQGDQQLTDNDLKKLARLIQEMQTLNDMDDETTGDETGRRSDDVIGSNDDDRQLYLEPTSYRHMLMRELINRMYQPAHTSDEQQIETKIRRPEKRRIAPEKLIYMPDEGYDVDEDFYPAAGTDDFVVLTPDQLASLMDNDKYGQGLAQNLANGFNYESELRRRKMAKLAKYGRRTQRQALNRR